MKRLLIRGFGALSLIAAASSPASAASVVLDPVGDFLPSYVGPRTPDLDVISFTVDFNAANSTFLLGATLAGAINPATPGLYVIGVNTGTGPIAPFANIGQPEVRFNQVVVIQKAGTATIGGVPLSSGAVSVTGNMFTAIVPLSLLPTTGASPLNYGFNLWPRSGLGNNNQISDFAPNNRLISVAAAVPEPTTWAMMIGGFGMVGGAMRSARRKQKVSVSYA